MNIVLSDPKEGRAYSKKTEEAVFVGRKIGETVTLDAIGLKGYKAVITGGSDKDGFPMKPSLEGQARKKLLMKKGIGIRNKRKGERRRKRVRGNTVAQDIHQLNLKITEYGEEKLSKIFGKPGEEKTSKEEKGEKQEAGKEAVGKKDKEEQQGKKPSAEKDEKKENPNEKKGKEEKK